jgi:hypothetical protein
MIVLILLLWQRALLLSILFVCLAYVKHKFIPIKKELFWFSLISISSGIAEIILVNISHAWSYSNPQLFSLPIYMPLSWGVLGTTLMALQNNLEKE